MAAKKKAKKSTKQTASNIIYLDGDFGEDIFFEAFDEKFTAMERNKRPITIRLNSYGGCPTTSQAIAGRLMASSSVTTVEVLGTAMSAALIVVAVADIRRASSFATFMHHDSHVHMSGRINQLVVRLAALVAEEKAGYEVMGKHTLRDAAWWELKANPEYYFNAKDALEIGLIDEIF